VRFSRMQVFLVQDALDVLVSDRRAIVLDIKGWKAFNPFDARLPRLGLQNQVVDSFASRGILRVSNIVEDLQRFCGQRDRDSGPGAPPLTFAPCDPLHSRGGARFPGRAHVSSMMRRVATEAKLPHGFEGAVSE